MEQLPEVSQEEFAQELLSETLQKVAMLEQQNLHLRMQMKKLVGEDAEEPELEIVSE